MTPIFPRSKFGAYVQNGRKREKERRDQSKLVCITDPFSWETPAQFVRRYKNKQTQIATHLMFVSRFQHRVSAFLSTLSLARIITLTMKSNKNAYEYDVHDRWHFRTPFTH